MRTLASTVAALKAELAAKKALEIAERNAGARDAATFNVSPIVMARAQAAADGAVSSVEKRGPTAFAPNAVS